MRIAVIGSGNIGGTLARKFAAAGHEVTFGSRTPGRDESGIPTADVATALRDAEVVVLAVPGGAIVELAQQNQDSLRGKLIVDATNNLGGGGPANARRALAATVSDLRYARAFNSLGWENLDNPRYGDQTGDMLFSAADADCDTVESLIAAVGLRPIALGEHMEDTLDGQLPVWFTLSKLRGRHLAFKVLDDSA